MANQEYVEALDAVYDAYQPIEKAKEALHILRAQYLERFGWKCTRDGPGRTWMWTKQLDGKHFIAVNSATAAELEQSIQAVAATVANQKSRGQQ